ncbi:MAG TPA: hypothetical protein VGL21_13095 [Jatrophihabitantaceae bacterium]
MTITDEYLDEVTDRGPRASEVRTSMLDDVAGTWYQTGYLSRPIFLARAGFRQLAADLDVLVTAILDLPQRFYGGDIEACARAVGLVGPQVEAVVRSSSPAPSRLARADLYQDESGFRLIEMNMGSNLGGLDNAVLNEAMLKTPFIADFAARHELTYVDTMVELARSILIECGVPPDTRPFMAAVDYPPRYPSLESMLERSAAAFGPLGIDCRPAPLDRLAYHDDAVWLDDQRVDIVYRLFHLEDVQQPGFSELLEPLLRAIERDQVRMFTALDSDMYGSKGALTLLSDEAHRSRYSNEELASLDRLVPWTRTVRPGMVMVDGHRVHLVDYAVANQSELVLKPTAEHGGQGVVLGWMVDASTWRDRLHDALDQPYVVQRRIHPTLEQFPTDDGVEPWLMTWGAFTLATGFGGFWMRGSRDLDGGVVNMATGATAMCCFHQT